ncbi:MULTISPECIES: hypothetical protein [Methanobacterium]|uniref:Uncharacterized protein n=1 Tax=Methanobacterium veterum TaxID=408577 RepID=A0A9E5DIR6_9EURY|nr:MULTISPECIES: hypothetical protein [Methanobacterium]MCZ3364453.1 hypothetical protein [Methanobacterium veterum]MCZ3372205.1 hypothetical protein [Methanobacterium veterum]
MLCVWDAKNQRFLSAETKSFLQKTVIKIGDYLIILAAIMVAIIFIASLFRHQSLFDTLQFALVLVVASIPIALPAVLSVTMAVGAVALAKKRSNSKQTGSY